MKFDHAFPFFFSIVHHVLDIAPNLETTTLFWTHPLDITHRKYRAPWIHIIIIIIIIMTDKGTRSRNKYSVRKSNPPLARASSILATNSLQTASDKLNLAAAGFGTRSQKKANELRRRARKRTMMASAASPQRPGYYQLSAWLACTHSSFANYTAISRFPYVPGPPASSCSRPACKSSVQGRRNKTCDCAIRAAFVSVGIDPKKERLRWHPDRFAGVVGESRRGEFQEAAREIFVVLGGMC